MSSATSQAFPVTPMTTFILLILCKKSRAEQVCNSWDGAKFWARNINLEFRCGGNWINQCSEDQGPHLSTVHISERATVLFKGKLFNIYEDLIVFLYATECSRVRACQFRMCGIYEWTMRTAVAQHTCVINTNFLVRVWVGLVYKKNRTCLTHVLINETLDPCQILWALLPFYGRTDERTHTVYLPRLVYKLVSETVTQACNPSFSILAHQDMHTKIHILLSTLHTHTHTPKSNCTHKRQLVTNIEQISYKWLIIGSF